MTEATNIAVFGLGYVGTVTAGCLAHYGYDVTGVDVTEEKVRQVNDGESPIAEPGVEDLVADGVDTGRLTATVETERAVASADVSFVCVGTPTGEDGTVDLSAVESVATDVGEALKSTEEYHTLVQRSTVPPGTTGSLIDIVSAAADRSPGEEFGVVMNPEFIREGSAVEDFRNPPFVVLGSEHDRALAEILDIYEALDVTPSQVFPVEPRTAEFIKYASNAFHATKVAFANEIGRAANLYDVDGRTVMEIFCQDRKLNISPYYLRPGFAFGGSCLHKDTKALLRFAEDANPELLESILPANEAHISAAVDKVLDSDPDTVGLAGLSFKPGTDDMRNSPGVYLARRLLDAGIEVRAYDELVRQSDIVGSNRAFVDRVLPELGDVLVASPEAVIEADLTVICTNDRAYERIARVADPVFDPVGLLYDERVDDAGYESLCW